MCPSQSHVLYPLVEAAVGPKDRAIIWNENLEVAFHDLKRMVSTETLLNDPDCKTTFTVHTYAYYKQLGAIISLNNKPIDFFLRKLSKTKRN